MVIDFKKMNDFIIIKKKIMRDPSYTNIESYYKNNISCNKLHCNMTYIYMVSINGIDCLVVYCNDFDIKDITTMNKTYDQFIKKYIKAC